MCDKIENPEAPQTENSYEKPAIIYDSIITTRAGSPILDQTSELQPDRPAIDLFPED